MAAGGPALQAVAAAVATACGVPQPRQPSGAVDWSSFVQTVDRHRVAPLVQRSGWLEEAGAPADVSAAVRERARGEALRCLRLLELQRDTLEALAAAGVDAVVLKGTALASEAYGDATVRPLGDLDVLVDPASVPRAVRALHSIGLEWIGWRAPDDPDREAVGPDALERLTKLPLLSDVTLERAGLRLELHWKLFPNRRLVPVDPGWLKAPRRIEVHGTVVPTLPLAAHWLYLMAHGSRHLWAQMKWLADVPALALRRPELVRTGALQALEPGHRRALATGLRVAEATFGDFLARETRAWAADVAGARVLVRRSLAALEADYDPHKQLTPLAMSGLVLDRLALRADARYRLEELRVLLLSAARAQTIEDPGLFELAAGPLRWTRRAARRLAKRNA